MTKINKLFTIEEIHEVFNTVKSGKDFPQFVKDLKSMGVTHYDNYVADGRTNYFGANNFVLEGETKYPSIAINAKRSADKLKQSISIHQQ